jgi:hypothetical protein
MDSMDTDDPRVWFRSHFPSYGPDWDAAVEYGVDMALLEENLKRTPAERLDALQTMLDLTSELRGLARAGRDDPEPP